MNPRKAPRLSEQILDEATTWFVEFSEGDVGTSAREAFIAWLRTSPEHVRAYIQVTAHWEDARSLRNPHRIDELVSLAGSSGADIVTLRPTTQVRPEAVKQSFSSGEVSQTRRRWIWPLSLCASVVVVLVGATAWYEFRHDIYSTDIGEQRAVTLADGSVIDLNSHSRVRVSYHEHQRDIELLDGQALFHVAKDPTRPFVVQAGLAKVRAVGTQFDVYKKPTATVVTVIEGKVVVFSSRPSAPEVGVAERGVSQPHSRSDVGEEGAAESSSLPPERTSGQVARVLTQRGVYPRAEASAAEIFLAAGEQATVSDGGPEKSAHADVGAATAWTKKQIVFSTTPLSEVVAEFNRYNSRKLVVVDPAINHVRISGVFSSTDPASLIRGLDSLRRFKINEGPDRIEISAP